METDILFKQKEQQRNKRKEAMLALALISPYIIVFVLFTLIPIVIGFVFSFMKYNPYDGSVNEFILFDNYKRIFDFNAPISKTFWQSFGTMLTFDLVAVPIMIIIPLTLAYFVNMHPPGYKLFRAIIYIPSIVSVSIMGIIFGNMFAGDSSGFINALFNTEIKWLSGTPWVDDTLRWFVMLIASIWWQTGSNFVIFSGALRDVPSPLYEACEMDGGNAWKKICYVTLPNIKPAIAICLFNTLIGYLNLYGQPYVLNAVENENLLVSPMMFIQNYLQGGVTYASQTGFLCAAAVVFGLIVMIFSTVERKVMGKTKRNKKHTKACGEYFAERMAYIDGNEVEQK